MHILHIQANYTHDKNMRLQTTGCGSKHKNQIKDIASQICLFPSFFCIHKSFKELLGNDLFELKNRVVSKQFLYQIISQIFENEFTNYFKVRRFFRRPTLNNCLQQRRSEVVYSKPEWL